MLWTLWGENKVKRPAAPLALAAAAGIEPRTPGQPLALAILYKYMFIISVRTYTHLVYWYKSLTTIQLHPQVKSSQTSSVQTYKHQTFLHTHHVHHIQYTTMRDKWLNTYRVGKYPSTFLHHPVVHMLTSTGWEMASHQHHGPLSTAKPLNASIWMLNVWSDTSKTSFLPLSTMRTGHAALVSFPACLTVAHKLPRSAVEPS